MSHTFTSHPSGISRGRGADRSRVSVGGRGTERAVRARAVGTGTDPNTNSRSSSTFTRHTQGFNNSSSTTRGRFMSDNRGRMNNQGAGSGRGMMPGEREGSQDQQGSSEGRGQHASGYTMFSPNEKQRRKVNQMAQRETRAYERYKQANSIKNYSYVGTVGGGEINEEQVRARQAQQVRAAKFNRQMKQEQHRQSLKKAEEDAIQAKRDDARRKAELNAQRQARVAPAEEVRRNREAFLAQFDKNSPGTTAASPPQGPTNPPPASPSKYQSGQQFDSNSNNNNRTSAVRSVLQSQAHPSRTSAHTVNINSSNARGMAAAVSGGESWGKINQDRRGQGQVNVKNEPNVFQTAESSSATDSHQQLTKPGVKAEVKQEEGYEDEPEHAGGSIGSHLDEEISILCSIYPDLPLDDLKGLLLQMGSLERAFEKLGLRD